MAEIIHTRPGYKVLTAVAEMRGPRLSDLAHSCGLPTSRTRVILDESIASDHVLQADRRLYVANDGFTTIARHSRSHHTSVKFRVTPAPVSGKTKAPMLEKRDKAVNQVYLRFQDDEFDVADGRRMGIGGLNDPTPWFPDLWVDIPADASGHTMVLHAVLIYPSTRSESAVKAILREFRSAQSRDPLKPPLLVIARDEVAAERFQLAGDDLRMLVATFKAFLEGVHCGPRSVWRYCGQVANVNSLAQLTSSRGNSS